MKIRHINNGYCLKCAEIFDAFPKFHEGLQSWFFEIQSCFPEAHISWAGRGRKDQNYFQMIGSSRAYYGQSAHNYNLAIDIFRLTQTGADYTIGWFKDVVGQAVYAHNKQGKAPFAIKWYGMEGASYKEMPHCEVWGWKDMAKTLVE